MLYAVILLFVYIRAFFPEFYELGNI